MKNTLVLAAVLAAAGIAIGSSANASTESHASKNDCVFTRAIHDFRPLDRNKMVIYGPGRKAYLVELSMPVPELKFANRLAFVDRDHNGMLCGYGMDRIVVADSIAFRTPTTILGMQRLDDAGLAQLEEQYDVRLTRKKKDAPASGSAQAPAGSAQPQEAAPQPEAIKEND
jgi:hypothetical protein